MSVLKNISIKNKLIVIQAATALIAVLICCLIFVINDIKIFKESSVESKYSIAEIVGVNSVAPLLFHDHDAANKILLNLNSDPTILNAVILDKAGKVFAMYNKNKESIFSFSKRDVVEKPDFKGDKFIVSYKIFQTNEFIGTVWIRSELTALKSIISNYIKVAIFVLIVAILSTLIISIVFQKIITDPLFAFVKKTKEVSENGDYSVRVSFEGNDEIGILAGEFNNMLAQIEKTQSALKESNMNLEERVKERTATLVKTQEFLKISEEKYRKIVEEAGDVVYSSNYKGYFTYFNPICKKLTGYAENELIGKHFLEIIDPEWKGKVAKFYKDQFENRIQETLFSFPIITKSGEKKWVEQIVIQKKDGDMITGQNAIVRDITDRKKNEEEIKKKSEELARSNQELEQFAYIASHDLQEPLRTISNFVGLFKKQFNENKFDKNSTKYLNHILGATERMQALIIDLLSYSRIGHDKATAKVDCNIVVNELLNDFNTLIKESNAEINFEKLPVINGHYSEIKSLFQNLLSNAIKFRKKDTQPIISITVKERDKDWLFAIKDNGIGIAVEYHERLFKIFQRLHSQSEYSGTGIGLAQCKKIVELHGGDIWVESLPEKGTTFYFNIPKTVR